MAMALATRKFDLLIVARRKDRLDALQQLITSTFDVEVETLGADLGTPDGLVAVQQVLAGRAVEMLVNNAGAGWIGAFAEAPLERQLEIIDVNCRSLIGLTHAVLPGMLQQGRGRIVQIASVAGFMPGPMSSVYYASKGFVVSHSEALRHELDVDARTLASYVVRFFRLWARNQWKRERYAPAFHLDDANLDPRTWCRFPILNGGYEDELSELEQAL
jgi:short-subunit dehydrogenase